MFKIYFKNEFEQCQVKETSNFEDACEQAKYYSKTSKYNKAVVVNTAKEECFIFEKGKFLD